MRQDKFPSYEDRFCFFSKSIEKVLIIVVIGLMLALVSSQLLLSNDAFRHWFVEVEKLEGVAS